ncbi:MAG TPA: sugar ABC transporter permease [Thermomicrobiales bacterium]|nr:sugar ABC transporter permease [Thermomicrobiales bacterium]
MEHVAGISRQHAPSRRRQALRREVRKVGVGLAFISPWIVGFVGFTVYPLLSSLYYSMTDYNLFSSPEWVGLENYRTVLIDDHLFRTALWNTLFVTVLGVVLGLLTSLPIALLLNTQVPGVTIYRAIYFLPSIVPVVAAAILWKWIFNANYGLLNAGLSLLHLPQPAWLADPSWIKPALVMMSLWGVGAPVILYLAALQDVPRQLYEVADLDGATFLQKTWNITLPMISPVILFNTIIAVIGWLQYFSESFIITTGTGGPANAALFYVLYLYQRAFRDLQMGYASALAWLLFVVTLAITLVILRLSRRLVYYEVK